MTYRILVDENTSPLVADLLQEAGHEAVHVPVVLDSGVTDRRIRNYAGDQGYVVLTHDADFLHPGTSQDVSILYYSDDTLESREIADRVLEVTSYVPDPGELPPITNLDEWQ